MVIFFGFVLLHLPLVLVSCPEPQVVEQEVQTLHSVQPPLTGTTETITLWSFKRVEVKQIVMKQILFY